MTQTPVPSALSSGPLTTPSSPAATPPADTAQRPAFTSMLQSWLATHIASRLIGVVEPRQAGYVFIGLPISDVWGRRDQTHRPGVSYFSKTSLPALPAEGDVRVVPDLIVEVVSPTDPAEAMIAKIHDYLLVGVKRVWVVFPTLKTVQVWHGDFTGRMLNLTHTLDGGDVLPGFTCPVADLFPKS